MNIFQYFSKSKSTDNNLPTQVYLYNTLSSKKELFIPQKPKQAFIYSCGPTVYSQAHIGNLRAYIFSDTIARTLSNAGYSVKRVINITDVGHLVGDGDIGDDKMSVSAKKENKSPEEIADYYTKIFFNDLNELNIDTNAIIFPRATEYIKEQIALIKTLEEKGFTYLLSDGLYFDTKKFPNYGRLGNVCNADLEAGVRVKVTLGKKSASDFVLWRKAKDNDLQKWDSPWCVGNPGWHIECSAMSRCLLGPEIDIHTGGEDHISVHHNNEIAQSEAASGRTFVHYWMHSSFLNMNNEKVSKSLGNVVYLSDISEKGFDPLALRYFFLQAHYRTPVSFSWQAIESADNALKRLWKQCDEIKKESQMKEERSEALDRFVSIIRDDLATPQALGALWEAIKSEDYSPEEKWLLIKNADEHLGLSLVNPPKSQDNKSIKISDLPIEIQEKIARRSAARVKRDFNSADKIRDEIAKLGYIIEDSENGVVLTKADI